MGNLTGADWAIFIVAAYVAVSCLVRLMRDRRDRLIAEFQQKMADEQQRKKIEARKTARKAAAQKKKAA